ncbi:hypothetical protein KKF69_06980, partial [Patescibacteria group bacterium]|nr:hypothetical protein [Patescibacteria group bacterium]
EKKQVFDWNKLTEEEKEKFVKVKKKLESGSDKDKEPGLFDILMDILKALFGIDDKEAGKIVDNSEAMRGLQAYWRIKPQNKWGVDDYGRVFFMLASDTSTESKGIQTKLETDARNAGFEANEISNKAEKIAEKHRESYPKQGDPRAISGHDEMANRAIAMNGMLWNETKRNEKEFDKLSVERLADFEEDIKLLAQKENESKDDASIRYLLRDINMGKMIKKGISGGSGSRDEAEKNEGGKKEGEKVKVSGSGGEEDKDGDEKKGKKPKSDIDKITDRLDRMVKSGEEVSSNTFLMLGQLKEINEKMGVLVESIVLDLSRDPGNIDLYRKYGKEYVGQRLQQMELEAQLEILTRGEKRVLGGEKDKYLYAGNIDEVLDERMKRIEYFIVRKQYSRDGKIDFESLDKKFGSKNKSVLNSQEPGIDDKEKEKRENFLKRTRTRCEEFENEGVLAKQEGLYFQEIQRWVGNILENSEYGYGKRSGKLRMPKDVYDKFVEIKDMKAYAYQYKNEDEYREKILEKIKILREEKFLDYFKKRYEDGGFKKDKYGRIEGVSYLNLEGKGVSSERGVIGEESYGYPSSLEATMLLIAEDKGAEWRTGAEHELIDASGKFHQENFILWMRKEMNKLTDWDPWTQIDPMRGILFKAGFSQISLFDILFWQQYTQHQELEMSGDVIGWYKGVKEKGSFSAGWGDKKDHPDMDYDTRVNRILIDEPWFYGIEHNDWVALNNVEARRKPEAYIETKAKIAQSNNYARSGLWLRRLMLPSHSGHGGKDTENYLKDKKQGEMGRLVNAGQLFYRYYTDFTEFYTEKKEGKATEVREKNNAYTALDIDGASIFLTSVAENSLGMANPASGKKIKELYRGFILERMDGLAWDFKNRMGAGDKRIEKTEQMLELYKKKVKDMKIDEIKISFDSFDKLTELQMKLETVVLGKTVVSAEEKKKFNLEDKKVVVKKEKEQVVKEKMREKVGVFLTDVLGVEIPKTQDLSEEEGKIIKSGKIVPVKIGDIEVLLDGKGRIVTKKEWEEMGGKVGDKKTIRQMMEEGLGENNKRFAEDSVKLEKYGQAVCEFDQAVEDGKGTKDIEDKIVMLEGDCRDVFKRRERLGLAMLTKVANIERKKLNFWDSTRPWEDSARKLVRNALMKALGSTYDLNDDEQLYAHDRIWYPLEHMDIAAFSNTSKVIGGVQMGTAYNRLKDTRENYQGLSTMGGSLETINEMRALRLPSLLERLKIRKRGERLPEGIPEHSLIEVMQGGDGADIKPRYKRRIEDNPDEIYETPKDWEHADFIDGLHHAEELRKLIVEENVELGSFHEIVTINAWGVMKVDYAKARKLFDAYWNHARLVFGSHQIDYDKEISVDGEKMKVRDYFFGPRTKETQDIMREYYEEMVKKAIKDGKTEDAAAYEKMASDIKNKPALAFVMNMVTSGIHEHMTFSSPYEMWSTQQVQEIAWIMESSFRQVASNQHAEGGKHGEGLEPPMNPSMMPYELFNRLLGVQEGDSMEKFMFWDLFKCLLAGFLAGIGEAQKEMEDELTGQMKKQWIG